VKTLYKSVFVIFVVACSFLLVTRPSAQSTPPDDPCAAIGELARTIAERRDSGMRMGAAYVAFPRAGALVELAYGNPQLAPEFVGAFAYGFCIGYKTARSELTGA